MGKKCNYRNCKKEITDGRSDKQYCNRNCKDMEQTYRKRNKKKLNKNAKNM